MARYKKNNYNDFSTRISRGSYQQDEDTLFDTLKRLIILGVAVVCIILYLVFCVLRGNKNDDLKGVASDDFVDDEQEKQ